MAHLNGVLQPRAKTAEVTAEQPESYQLRQENELQVLESIYGRDFQDLRLDRPWEVIRKGWPGFLFVGVVQTMPGGCKLGIAAEAHVDFDLLIYALNGFKDG